MIGSDDLPDAAALRQRALDRVAARDFVAAGADLRRLPSSLLDDAAVQLALAETAWNDGGAAAALPHFEAALAIDPNGLRTKARFALALHETGRAAEALSAFEAVVEALPADRSLEAMAAPLAAPFAFTPAAADVVFQLGQMLLAVGDLDRAIAAFDRAAALDPDGAPARLALGIALQARGDQTAAIDNLRAAVARDADAPEGWRALAQAFQQLGQTDEADTYAVAALCLERAAPDSQLIVGNALLTAGAPAAARMRFARILAGASWAGATARRDATRPRVGVIAAPGRANTPLDFILDRARLSVEIVLMLDDFDYPYDRIATSYDVLFNAVADADEAAEASALAATFAERVRLPTANHPGLIADTGRERIAARMAGTSGCVVPTTGRYATATLRSPSGAAQATRDIGLPLLVRPIGSHGGTRLERIDDAAALQAYLDWTSAEWLYLSRYHDFRSADDGYRKYRFIAVDGVLLPYHLAIGDHWLVHYFRTGMAEDATLRAEEARFLSRPFDHVGPTAAAALHEIARRAGLDYCGIDCAVLADGRLLLFECNAAMLVRHGDQPEMFDYRRPAAEAIRDAVSAMLERRAGIGATR